MSNGIESVNKQLESAIQLAVEIKQTVRSPSIAAVAIDQMLSLLLEAQRSVYLHDVLHSKSAASS